MKIHHSALRPVRGFVGEIAAARALEQQLGSDVTVSGGSRKAVDIEGAGPAGDVKADAKALVPLTPGERVRWEGCTFKFARDKHAPFDADAITHVALVDLEACSPTAEINGGDRLTIDVDLSVASVSLVPVNVVNEELLDPDGGRENNWRYVVVADDVLERYRATT